MSINMDNSGMEYADHEVQVITNQIDWGPGDGDDDEEEVTLFDQLEPVSNRGLDSDELAELVGFYRSIQVHVDNQDSAETTQLGNVLLEAEIGINLSEDELVNQANNQNATSSERDTEGDATDELNDARGANYDEPGVLDFVSGVATSGFEDSGNGAAAVPFQDDRQMFFPEYLGSGPFVDRTDDITVFAEMNANNINARVNITSDYVLYWNVHEMPEGRASFARP